ncbi:MAG: competence protein comGF [Bacillus sp. (in: firmicutes)]|nr:competence protein comGF [Bacillus sp. (in: firmicutes)]
MSTQSPIKNVKVLNSNGFTLIEMLFAFSIFCTIVSFLPLSFRLILNEVPFEKRIQRMEWEVFTSQIKKEIRMSTNITVLNQTLLLQKDGQTIIYEKYGTNLRRRVDYKGHEILLQNVGTFQFEKIGNGIRVKLVDKYGHEYREDFQVFIRDVVS